MTMKSEFLLGSIKITPEAKKAIKRLPYDLVARHAMLEHGIISPAERRSNEVGLQTLGRIVSRYRSDPTDPQSPFIVIVTETTWKETRISLEPVKSRERAT